MTNYRAIMLVVSLGLCGSAPTLAATLYVQTQGGTTTLNIDSDPAFHSTTAAVSGATLVAVPGTPMLLVYWNETPAGGRAELRGCFALKNLTHGV